MTPDWTPALAAAVIDVELESTRPIDGFSRDHIVALHNVGCSRTQVREYLVSVFGVQTFRPNAGTAEYISIVDHIMSDLDSYGAWKD